ncbi:hypothetical protein ACETAC_01040 [Aceticella autotrophica]|uniref:Isoprenylcysteine carboxylmethyltransferase family protein n=1 Tax=Aceticella autotrophica TaxID=2755338 RepID=A0A975AW29_9THEO|nr:methyltransferase [Aceticella autotrophica]QSZ27541.1 hypothetical protein ACETAC_01040 [Aceticella autotrophica]
MPKFSIQIWNGWWFTLIYLFIFLCIPFLREGAFKRLFTPANPYKTFWETVNYNISLVAWIGSVFCPVFIPVNTGTIYFYIGIFIYVIGMVLFIIALYNYVTAPLDQPIIKGLYYFSRNPIYVTYDIMWYGVGFTVGSWLLIIIHTIEAITCHFLILEEERFCLKKYGRDYQDYMDKVPRYIRLW